MKHASDFSFRKWKTMRQWWRKNPAGRLHRRRDGHAAAEHVPMWWGLDFNRTSLYIGIQITKCTEWAKSRYIVYSKASNLCIPTFGPLCILTSALGKIPLAPDLPECNYCLSWRVPVHTPEWATAAKKYFLGFGNLSALYQMQCYVESHEMRGRPLVPQTRFIGQTLLNNFRYSMTPSHLEVPQPYSQQPAKSEGQVPFRST